MSNGKKVLLAFGEGVLDRAVCKTLQEGGFQVTRLGWAKKVRLPKGRYDYLIQMGKDPAALTEGTHQLLEKAKKEKAEFLLVSSLKVSAKATTTKEATYLESLHFAEALTKEFHKKHGLGTIVLRLPTIFGPGFPLAESGTLGHLVSEFADDQVRRNVGPVLTVYGEGKDSDYYLYLTDAAEAVKSALVVKNKEGGIYFTVPPAPLTSAAIAEILKEMGGGRHEIRYHKGLAAIEREVKLEGKALPHFKPKISMKEGILQTLKALPASKADLPSEKKRRLSIRIPRLRRPSRKRMLQLAAILLILSPFLYVGVQASLATYHLSQLRRQIGAFDFQTAGHSAEAAKASFIALNRSFGIVPFFSRKTPLRDLRLLSQGGAEASTALTKLLAEGKTALTSLENLLKSYQGEAVKEQTEEEFNRLATTFEEVEDRLLTTWLYFDQIHPSFHRLLTPYLNLLQEGLTATRLGGGFATAAQDLLGYQGERNYLILFQNSAEIWAGGGAVTSLAHLSLEGGGIKTLEFYDLYDFQNVKGVEGETPVIFGLGDRPPTHIALSPNFSNNAKFVGKVFEQATEVVIDGVIGIDLHFAESLLAITGPLQLTDFGVEVTPENFFEVAETEVEKEFFPGSAKKKRFMQALGEGVLAKLFAIEREDYAEATQLAWGQLQDKGILLYSTNPELYQAVIESNFAGLIRTTPGDYLFPLDHNTGTKGTVWIKREIIYKVYNSDREGTLQGELTITWRNEGTSSWPAGKYTNIFRVLVPKGARLVSAHLGQEGVISQQRNTFEQSEDVTRKILVTEEAGKGEFGTHLEIEPQTARTLKLIYDLPEKLNLKNISTYQLTVQKQPGTVGDPFSFTFEEPFGKRISGEGLQKVDSYLIFKKDLERDIALEVSIEAKEGQ